MPLLDSWLFAWVDGGLMAANMRAACINMDSSLTVFTLTMWCQASTFLELAACLFYVSFSKKQLSFVPPISFFPLFSILEIFLSWLEKCVTNFKQGFPHSSVVKKSACQCRRLQLNSWVGKIPWRKERLPTLVFWPGEFHGLHSSWGRKEAGMTEWPSRSLSWEGEVKEEKEELRNTWKPERCCLLDILVVSEIV